MGHGEQKKEQKKKTREKKQDTTPKIAGNWHPRMKENFRGVEEKNPLYL